MTEEEREKVIEILLERISKHTLTSAPTKAHNKVCKQYLVNRTDEELLAHLVSGRR